MRKRIIAFLLVFLLLFSYGCNKAETKKSENKTNTEKKETKNKEEKKEKKKKPIFSAKLVDFSGKEFDFDQDKGKKVVLIVMSTGWPHCVKSLGELDKTSKEYNSDDKVRVYAVFFPGLGGEKSKEKLKEWLDKKGTKNLKVLLDTTGDFARKYSITAIPTSIYINTKKEYVGSSIGVEDKETIKYNLESIDWWKKYK